MTTSRTSASRCRAPSELGARSLLRAAALGLGLAATPALAQDAMRPGIVQSEILTVEIDRLYAESDFGKEVSKLLEETGTAIAAENRRIEAELTAEEKSLTEKRRTMDATAFRKLADAFDTKVQELRDAQDSKARTLGNLSEERRRAFISQAEPVLADLMRDAGASVILDQRTVFLSTNAIDITETAISRMNEVLPKPDPLPDLTSTPNAQVPVSPDTPPKP
ncbi:outer membrane chaperone Skp [Alloyangia pacifica]|uniref:Outer membrane chaperone Skp n=1 Tax=Alloyangia pacifica TaxID=311180 RepID=A0A2U8HC10_9RHOB|nr:outer membrane chaperone Skp [Alloyangia pacifica]NDV51744.1 OmpH family outer membrane protein [Salipiger sp. PrR003]NDW31976.1 OmpH family outer membrane protein [Salipiger sp. PrR007]